MSVVPFLVTLAFWVPAAVRGIDYNDAYECSSAPNPACYVEQRATVEAVDMSGEGNSAQHYLVLSGFGEVYLTSGFGVWDTANAGDVASARVFRGVVDAVEVRGVTSQTRYSPDVLAKRLTGVLVGTFGLILVALFLWAAAGKGRMFVRSGVVYALWGGLSGVALAFAIAFGPTWLWLTGLVASAVIAVLIAIEFAVLQPRIAAREAEEAQDADVAERTR